MKQGEISIYAADDKVCIDTPVGVCYIAPQVAIEMTISLTKAARNADPELDVAAIMQNYLFAPDEMQ
jgi:hypothetical protein